MLARYLELKPRECVARRTGEKAAANATTSSTTTRPIRIGQFLVIFKETQWPRERADSAAAADMDCSHTNLSKVVAQWPPPPPPPPLLRLRLWLAACLRRADDALHSREVSQSGSAANLAGRRAAHKAAAAAAQKAPPTLALAAALPRAQRRSP